MKQSYSRKAVNIITAEMDECVAYYYCTRIMITSSTVVFNEIEFGQLSPLRLFQYVIVCARFLRQACSVQGSFDSP